MTKKRPDGLPPYSPPPDSTIELTDQMDPTKPDARPIVHRDPDEVGDETVTYDEDSRAKMQVQVEKVIGERRKRQERAAEIFFLENHPPRLRIAVLLGVTFLVSATGMWAGNVLSRDEDPAPPPPGGGSSATKTTPSSEPTPVPEVAPSPEPTSAPEVAPAPEPKPEVDEFAQLRESSYELLNKKSYEEALEVLNKLNKLDPENIEVTEDLLATYWKLKKAAEVEENEEATEKFRRKANQVRSKLPKDQKEGAIGRSNRRVREWAK